MASETATPPFANVSWSVRSSSTCSFHFVTALTTPARLETRSLTAFSCNDRAARISPSLWSRSLDSFSRSTSLRLELKEISSTWSLNYKSNTHKTRTVVHDNTNECERRGWQKIVNVFVCHGMTYLLQMGLRLSKLFINMNEHAFSLV
jgi:hypothetical protein